MTHVAARRVASRSVAAAAVALAVGACGSDTQHVSSARKHKPPACFVTGLGTKLCGADAVAYCRLHVPGYINDELSDTPVSQDIQSVEACLSVGYQPTAQDEHDACIQFAGQDPLPKPQPLPESLRGDC